MKKFDYAIYVLKCKHRILYTSLTSASDELKQDILARCKDLTDAISDLETVRDAELDLYQILKEKVEERYLPKEGTIAEAIKARMINTRTVNEDFVNNLAIRAQAQIGSMSLSTVTARRMARFILQEIGYEILEKEEE